MSSLGETVNETSMSSDQMKSLAIEKIKHILGDKGFTDNREEMTPFLTEWRGFYSGDALLIVFPENVQTVSSILKICAEAYISIVPQGGNTSMCGGAVPSSEGNSIVLSMAKMNNILSIDTTNYTMTVEAGCILQNIQKAAEAEDRYFPLSLAAEGSCMIGGNLATNAGGTNVLRYGNARELVLGLEVVLPDGRILDQLTGLRKDNTG